MLTLRALLEGMSPSLIALVPGPAGALDEPVSWVHNTELPDPSAYVGERELVLTNGLWLDAGASPHEFVAHARSAGAVGIVYGLRVSAPSTPATLIEACDAAGLPLLELAVDVPFTAISKAASLAQAEERQRSLLEMVRRGNALADAVAGGAGMRGVLALLRRDGDDLPVAVVDRAGALLAASGAQLDESDLQAVAEALARRPPPLELTLGTSGVATLFLVAAVGPADAALVCLRPARAMAAGERQLLEQVAHYLGLEITRTHLAHAVETRFAGELLDMIQSDSRGGRDVAARLARFGVDPSERLAVLALAWRSGADAGLAELAQVARDTLASEGVPAVVAPGGNDVVVILGWRRPDADLVGLADRLVALARRASAGGGVPSDAAAVVGVSDVCENSRALRQALTAARDACRILGRRRGGADVVRFADLGTYRLVLGTQEPETLRRFAATVVDPLRRYDRDNNGDLVATVRTFLDHDGQWSATAAALFIHVNTLRYRMARVVDLTGRDPSTTEGRVELFLALEADTLADQWSG